MFASFVFIFSCFIGFAGGVWGLCYFIAKYQRRFAKKIKQDTLNDLTMRGIIKRQGEVGIIIQHVHNPEIVDTFIKKFNEAYTQTAHCIEFHNGEVKLWFKIQDVNMANEIRDELEKAGFYIGGNQEDIT